MSIGTIGCRHRTRCPSCGKDEYVVQVVCPRKLLRHHIPPRTYGLNDRECRGRAGHRHYVCSPTYGCGRRWVKE